MSGTSILQAETEQPYYDLGSYHRPIETPSPQAQSWLDRGMVWAYAFNHEEAIRCFDRALELDPDLAIARWGVAYSIGPNYNKAWEAFDPVDLAASLARARMELGLAATGRAAAVEHGLIEALHARRVQPMPSHIDVLCGNYRDSVVSNLSAVHVDRRFVEREGPLNFYSLYRAHNLHFIVYSAMFEVNSRAALEAADELAGQLTPELLAIESPPMADWLEAFVPLRIHVLVRFGRWDELIAQSLPEDVGLYCSTAATIHYGRGVAHAAKGQLPQAHAERDAFTQAYARIPETRYLFNHTARDI